MRVSNMRVCAALCLWFLSMPAFAQGAEAPVPPPDGPPASEIVDLAPILASDSGPGLWKVTRGDHVLWILGTLSPLPRDADWLSREVEDMVAQAQEVIEAPSYEIDPNVSIFGKLFLLPAAMRARRNPDGARLRDIVPAAEYARWRRLKARHLGGDRGVERYRPIFAAGTLYKEALEDAGLTYDKPAQSRVVRFARARGVRVTRPEVGIGIDSPRAALKAFARQRLDDARCFSLTLDRVEHELGTMRELADAWAVGDLERMRALPETSAQYRACSDALAGSAIAREHGVGDLRARTRAAWLAAVERALTRNKVTVALLPIGDLLEPRGMTATLRERGYTVEDPESRIRLAASDPQD